MEVFGGTQVVNRKGKMKQRKFCIIHFGIRIVTQEIFKLISTRAIVRLGDYSIPFLGVDEALDLLTPKQRFDFR